MEKMYPILKRPKRKLCYLTTECPPKQWGGRLSLGDVDKMFDDIDPSLNDDTEELSPTSLLHISDTEASRSESSVTQQEHRTKELPRPQMIPERHVLHPAFRPPSADIDLDVPFKAHGPVKTSSPIEEKNVEGVEKVDNRKVGVMSPILFACEDDGKEEANARPLRSQKCNGIDDSDFASPPSRVSLIKPKMSSHKNTVELCSSREPQPLKGKTTKKPQTTELQHKIIIPGQKNRDPPMSAVRHKPEVAAPVEKSEKGLMKPSVEVSSCVEKETTTFLQKLRDAGQPKPSRSRKSLTPVKVPSPPVPEDCFLILEDDTPLWISIPSKASTNKRHSTDKDSSADKGANGSPKKTVTKQQGTEQPSQTVNQKVAKTKKNEKKNEAAVPGSGTDEVCSPEDVPGSDLKEQVKAKKKKRRLKEVSEAESDEAEEQPQDTDSRETKNPTENTEKKNKPKDTKRVESLRDGRENGKTSKSSKRAKKVTQETVRAEAANAWQEQTSEEREHVEDLCFLDNEISYLEAQMNVKDKQHTLGAVSEESSSRDGQVIGKRRRRQPGQWWMSCSEETKVTDSQPTQKKQNKKEPKAATASPVRGKKDRILKRGDQQPAPSSVQNTKTQKLQKGNKEKRNNQNKNVNRKGEAPVMMAVFDEVEAEEDTIQELDPLHSSPLVLTNRDLILNSDNNPFQSVYRHVAKQKMSATPAVASPKRPKEQLLATEPEKRRRKPPVNWWMVGASDDGQSSSLQQKVKPHKERKGRFKQIKSPGLGTPKSGNMAVSPRPPGGAPVSPLRMKPESAPKTVSRSLATFKDIFTSVTETPLVIDSREAAQNNTHGVTTCPAVGVTVELGVTDHATCSQAEAVVSVDAGEPNSPPNMDPQENSRFNALRSGPSSMIELEPYEDNDELNLPLTRVGAVLSASDLCAPPLKPLVLHPKDKASLTEWFKSLWSTPANSGPEITPDHFDWYFYQGRVIGIQVDLNCGSICNGKILLGSYTKKPLWVDHSATTVFNLLTGSVSVIINGRESSVNPAQSFMVPCAHAYSIQNVLAQPAVLYFTRIFAESSD